MIIHLRRFFLTGGPGAGRSGVVSAVSGLSDILGSSKK
jgi:hypothetical protein